MICNYWSRPTRDRFNTRWLATKDTVWAEPKLTARIEFRGITEDGMPRHPGFKGLD